MDCADELDRKGKFRNVDEFKKLLLQDKDQIARSLTEKLLVFATGHKMEFADRDTRGEDRRRAPVEELRFPHPDPRSRPE